jgi:inorganic pyrophosphatase
MPILLSDDIVNALIVGPAILGIVWSVKSAMQVNSVKIDGHPDLLKTQDSKSQMASQDIVKNMIHISGIIQEGATAFLWAEYKYMFVYIVLFSIFLVWFTGVPSTIAFVVGALTSILAGWIGMKIAVFTNVRTTHQCWKDLSSGFDVAIQGGCVMGLSLVAIGVIDLFVLILCFKTFFSFESEQEMYDAIAGYGLGGSSIALFGRVGGGIYTKAADVGADLSGKNEFGMDEDDPRNPACIADNVGDNVGDIAGMGADLFGSFAESTCAALVLASSCPALAASWTSLMYPVLISSIGIVVGVLTLLVCGVFYPVKELPDVEKALKGVLVISTVLMTPTAIGLSYACLPDVFLLGEGYGQVAWWYCALSICLGLWSGLIIGYMTEYYTSHSYTPVREIAETQKVSAATGVIYGLALGYLSCIVPVICLGITILVSHSLCGMFGVALGALGMLGTMTMGLTIDAYGPISDNAGGIAEMSGLGEDVRKITDGLDAAGNTTAAIGKGFAIGSAALVSLALFGAFTVRAGVSDVNILDPWVFTGLLFGAMMPYAFAAWTMKSVGMAANDMVKECMEQFPKIINGEMAPDYQRCILISTEASLREMLAPGALVILSPLVAGFGFGKNATAGLLSGAMVSSVQLAISMSNTGGAWDNSKKYIEAGGLGPDHRKGSAAHKNAVTGDTVGDPLKDTSGPALNIVMKLTAIISLVFGSAIAQYSNESGGPIWLKA